VHFVKTMRSLGPRYIALWVGQTVSQLGTYIALLTVLFLVDSIHEATGNGGTVDFALTYSLETVPTLLVGLVGGALLDRWHLRPVMIATDLVRASIFFYLAANFSNYGLGTVFALAFLIGSMTTMFDGAMYSLIPSIVPPEKLPDANSFVAASQQAMFALGPALAGLLAWISEGPEVGLFLNGLTFVVSAASLHWVGRIGHHRDPAESRSSVIREAVNGIRYLWSQPRLRITTIASAIPNFVIGFVEATFVVLAYVVFRAQTELEVGILLGAVGVGGLIGALIAPSVTRRLGLGRTLVLGLAVAGVGLFAVMFTTYGALALALQVGWMLGISVINIPLATIRQHYSHESILGRVITGSRAIGWATLPLGALIGGWLGNTDATYPWVARTFPIILIATAVWLVTTIIWSDTFGPGFDRPPASLKEAADHPRAAET
jgi:MFS family permease